MILGLMFLFQKTIYLEQKMERMPQWSTNLNESSNKVKEKNSVSLFINKNTAVFFDSFGIEYVPQKSIKQNQR